MATVIVPIRAKDETKRGVQQVEKRFAGLRSGLVAGVGALGITTGIAGAVATIQAGVNAAGDFETALTNITARVELADDELEAVRQTALALGPDTKFSATEAAEGMLELITSGSTAEEALATIPHVLDLAAASGDALGQTADAVTDIMAQFALETEHAEDVVNTLTAAAGSSSATVSDLSMGMANAGAVANSYGISLDETSAALAVLAENGIKGAEGGTALRSALLNATKETKNSVAAWRALGTTWFDSEGQARPLDDIIKDINEGLADKTPEEANLILKDLFGTYGITAANALLAADGIEDMQEAMAGQRTAAEVADEQMQTFQAQMDSLGSTMQTLAIKVFTPFIKNILIPLIMFVIDAVNAFSEWTDTTEAQAFFAGVELVIGMVLNRLIGLWNFITGILQGDWVKAFEGMLQYILGFPVQLNQVIDGIVAFANGIITVLENAFRGILTFVENILNSIIRLVNDTLNSLPDFVKDTVFNVTGGRIDIKQGVGLLQETNLAGGFTLPRVQRPNIGGAGAQPVTVNINAQNLIGDERQIAAQVGELIRQGVVAI